MGTSEPSSFDCQACGKQYRWKAELAGKRVKCKCGAPLTVPKAPASEVAVPIAVASDDPFAEALASAAAAEEAGGYAIAANEGPRCAGCAGPMEPGAVVCMRCGYNVKLGTKLGVEVAGQVAVAAPA